MSRASWRRGTLTLRVNDPGEPQEGASNSAASSEQGQSAQLPAHAGTPGDGAAAAASPGGSGKPKKKRPGSLFRKFRRTVRWTVGFGILGAIGLIVASRGPVPRYLVEREVRKYLEAGTTGKVGAGGKFALGKITVQLDGRVVAQGLKLDGLGDEASKTSGFTVASVKEVVIDLDWSAWAAGVVVPREVTLHEPRLTLSVRPDGQLDLGGLKIPAQAAGAGSGVKSVPRIELRDGILVLGETTGSAGPTGLMEMKFSGWLSPISGSSRYLLHGRLLRAGSAEGSVAGLARRPLQIDVTGEIDFEAGSALIDVSELAFADIRPEELPSQVREVWRELAMRGKMRGGELRVTQAGGVEATVDLEGVSLTVPIASGRADIVGSRKPRMDNVNGFVRFSGGSKGVEGAAAASGSGSAGGLEASLSGSFEDLPAQLLMQSDGLSTDAAYHAVIIANDFNLEQDPRLLWFTPEIVQTNFERFSGPTARIDARIELDRGRPEKPGVPGETSIRGALSFSGGRAAFDKFPYPINELSGTVRFDDDRVDLVGIQGRGPSGALLFAEGVFDPPTADSRINLTVSVANLPMDTHLIEALNRSRGKALVDAIFSRDRLNELIAKGLVVEGQSKGEGSPPGFSLDGTIDALTVKVQSPFGFESPTSQIIDVRFDDVGILTKFFPYPIRGKNVLVRVGDDFAAVTGREFTGVSGGTGQLDAYVKIEPNKVTGEWGFEPAVSLRTRGFPIDDLLIHALPEPGALGSVAGGARGADVAADLAAKPEQDASESLSAKEVLAKLGLRGPVDADVTLLPGVDGGKSRLLADLLMQGLTSQPEHFSELSEVDVRTVPVPLTIRNLTGAIRVSNELLTINSLEGFIERRVEDGDALPSLPGFFRMEGRWPLVKEASEVSGRGTGFAPGVDLLVENLDVDVSLEDLVRSIEPEIAKKVTAARRTWDFAGRLDAQVTLEAKEDSPASDLVASVTVSNAESVSVKVDDRYVQLTGLSGEVSARMDVASPLRPGDANAADDGGFVISARGLESELRIDEARLGRLMADGVVRFNQGSREGRTLDFSERLEVLEPLTLKVRDVVLDSPLVLEGIERFAPEGVQSMYSEFAIAGLIDAEVKLAEREREDPRRAGTRLIDRKQLRGAIRPVWLAGNWQGKRVEIESISGEVSFDGQAGAISELRLLGSSFEIRADGAYQLLAGGGMRAEGEGSFDGAGLTDEVRGLMPAEVQSALEEAKVQIEQDLLLEDVRGVFESRPSGAGNAQASQAAGQPSANQSEVTATARVIAAGVSAETGAAWRSPEIRLDLQLDKKFAGDWAARAEVVTPRVIVNDLAFANVEAVGVARGRTSTAGATSSGVDTGTDVVIERLLATTYGGQVELKGKLRSEPIPADGIATPRQMYEASVRFDGVRLADLMIALAERKEEFIGPRPDDGFVRAFEILPDTSRGMLSGMASVRGLKGDDRSRVGRGMVRVAGGEAIVNIPLVVPLLQISNLQIPSGESLDYAYGQASLVGSELKLDQAAVLSDSLALLGTGTIDLRDQGIDLRLRSLSRRRVPILSDVFEGLRDQLFTAHVVGTVQEPEFEIESLLSIRRALAGSADPLSGTFEIDLLKLERDRERTMRPSMSAK